MSNSANTGSTLDRGATNKTSTSISTNILIMVRDGGAGIPVGAIQELVVNEKRKVTMINEVGTDGHIDSVPVSSTDITGSCKRVRFDAARIAQAFGRGFIHVGSQAYPFDIIIKDKTKQDQGNWIITTIRNVWIIGIDVTYSADNWIITENMQWEAETINSFRGTSGVAVGSVATSGERSIPHYTLSQEQDADTGANGKRGALDVDGLIDIGSGGSPGVY